LREKLVHVPRSICVVPNLCIHYRGSDERNKLEPNTENHLRPVFASKIYEDLKGTSEKKEGKQYTRHYAGLIDAISSESGISADKIIDFELCFADTQPGALNGINHEFIASPRLDNLFSSYAALTAIIDPESHSQDSGFINMTCLFDHEEIGSNSQQGADSPLLGDTLARIFKVLTHGVNNLPSDAFDVTMRRSFVISADQAHGIHPNYADKHQTNH